MDVLKKEIPTAPVDADLCRLVSKSRAQKFLRLSFREARFQTVTGPEGQPAGWETWQLWCKGSYGKLVPLVEVTGPLMSLPYAVTREALARIGMTVQVNATTMKAVPMVVDTKPAPAAPAAEPTLAEQGRE